MANSTLPKRPSLEFLRKLAKERLSHLRQEKPAAQLADALLAVARDHGFSSWRALKAEVDRRCGDLTSSWFEAVRRGDIESVRRYLQEDGSLIHSREPRHDATALHIAAAVGDVPILRLLLDAGADPNDYGDDAQLGVIGSATHVHQGGDVSDDAVSLLLERGGRHDIFSAIAVGNLKAIRTLVEERPDTLDARRSLRYGGQTPLHFALTRDNLAVLDLLLALGADVDATDHNGQTALEFALLRGHSLAADRLRAAGADVPSRSDAPRVPRATEGLADSIQSAMLVIASEDVASTLSWYASIGFTEVARYPTDESTVFWGLVKFGMVEISFDVRGGQGARGAALVLSTDRIQDFYDLLASRQLETANVEFVRTLHEPEHGGLEFSIRDPNGFILRFHQQTP